MIAMRPAQERGHANFGWLDTHHTFSFGHYYDPKWMGHSALRVINEDHVTPGSGFGTHPHANMEILTCVLEGAIEHKDSLGNVERIPAGEFQLMSAGSGIRHSEYNPSPTEPLSFLQIWIEPNEHGTTPGYQQKRIEAQPGMTLVASPTGEQGSFTICQQARVWRLQLAAGESLTWALQGRNGYLHMISGELTTGGLTAQAGDGLFSRDEPNWELMAESATEALLFDLP
ncbi:pirin family protein [Aeromonas simiae]|uniref:pirin family protein n=1 Tax=Aeromonas simiae TaxID=218936 RepID=UPI00266BAE54|nr:pirin family protein [Aeromonas simiae]MDO2950181.1 pirin family protein [Aeromonas simiae]MDO2953481.1 pirin family protein [Aeromonas simiae]MDO2957589.1 pirin family protein [Aeromonas simiae]